MVVHQFKAPRFFIPFEKARFTVHLSYHGEHHYNSVRAIDDEGPGPARPITLQTPTSKNGPRAAEGETRLLYFRRKVARAITRYLVAVVTLRESS